MSEPSAPFSSMVPALKPVLEEGMLTIEQVKQAVPTNLRTSITQEYVDKLNAITTDEVMRDAISRNFISYTGVLKEGKYKTEDYLCAVAFVSFKLMGMTDKDAYIKTFPDRYLRLVQNGQGDKEMSSYVSIYKKGKLVNLILEQTMTPAWVLNSHMFQEALNTQFDLMRNAESEKVRTEAANSLLTHLKKPEAAKGGVTFNLNQSDQAGMAAITNALHELADVQRGAISSGQSKTIDIAAMKMNTDVEDV